MEGITASGDVDDIAVVDWNDEEIRIQRRVPEIAFRPFTPRRIGVYEERFQLLATRLDPNWNADGLFEAIEAEYAWASRQRGAPSVRDRYRTSLCVLKDLFSQGWVWRYRDHRLEVAPPDYTTAPTSPVDAARQKADIRKSMAAERLSQLEKDSTKAFLTQMERPRRYAGASVCVLDLIADGQVLAGALRAAASLAGVPRESALRTLVQPYLQLVSDSARCQTTGLRLIDIWRYFRYSWSLPYFSTPGRNLFYLVRDASQPLHPIVGIAALGNSIVRLGDRDDWIGWTLDSFAKRVKELTGTAMADDSAAKTLVWLERAIALAIADVDHAHLLSPAEFEHPSESTIGQLIDRARTSARARVTKLRTHASTRGSGSKLPKRQPAGTEAHIMMLRGMDKRAVSLADESVDDLFDQKRASELAELLRATRALQAVRGKNPMQALSSLLDTEDGRRGVSTAIKAVKKRHIGTSMMDVIICGAVAPYTHILGGKLACMLLTSPQVRQDYRNRYQDAVSAIASRMKGENVSRPAELVLLGTTSLYHVGSSQYNRVRVPGSLAGGHGEIQYQRLGATRGYGSVHFSQRTRVLLEVITAEQNGGATLITRTFGEGVNPKLRLVREGLACIGLDTDHLLQHQCRRIIYGVPLAHNAREYLRGEVDSADYVFPFTTEDDAQRATESIAEHWRRRWLAKRIDNEEVIERVLSTDPADLRMSGPDGNEGPGLLAHAEARQTPREPLQSGPLEPPPSAGPIGVAFIQQLYNHRSCYADRLTAEQIDAIHVETPVEDFVLNKLKVGTDIVLTGNPGDGKTHLIMRLTPQLAALGVRFEADATAAESYESIIRSWKAARKAKKAFCLAINEWPLLELLRGFEGTFAPLKEVRSQVDAGIVYSDESSDPPSVIVVDLNQRTVVERGIVDRLIGTLTHDRFYPECGACPARETCAVPRARRELSQARPRQRLFRLLEMVAKHGHHVTMRDLQGLIAYLIAGGRSCRDLIAAEEPMPYYSSAFSGTSGLFDALRSTFDPALATHPRYDDALWNTGMPGAGWLPSEAPPLPASAAPDNVIDAMRDLKRRFFFEHSDGEKLLALLPPDERRFFELLDGAKSQPSTVIREMIRLINQFFDCGDGVDDALRLWSRHRYDARWSPAYVSTRKINADRFRVRVPRLNPLVASAQTFVADHFVLQPAVAGTASLRVDLPLLRTLYDARRGLPLALRAPEMVKRIDLFFNDLARAEHGVKEITDAYIKNFETGAELAFKIDRSRQRYGV